MTTDNHGPAVEVVMERHLTHRRHSTWVAHVPTSMLTDTTYFTEFGEPTPAFDQWMCDNGEETQIEYSEDGNPDVEDLNYELVTDIVAMRDPAHLIAHEEYAAWANGGDWDHDLKTVTLSREQFLSALEDAAQAGIKHTKETGS